MNLVGTDQTRIYGDTEQGGIAQSLRQSGMVFKDGGYRNFIL